MIVAAEGDTETRVGWMVPSNVLLRLCPEIRTVDPVGATAPKPDDAQPRGLVIADDGTFEGGDETITAWLVDVLDLSPARRLVEVDARALHDAKYKMTF